MNPWILRGIYVTSFDFIKQPEVLRPLEDAHWEVLVVDEAHGATLATARRAAVHAIALRSSRVLLLTATPHAGDANQFAALCRIGETAAADDQLILFARSRTDVSVATVRRTALLSVRLSDAERRMHRLLDGYTDRICREARARGDARALQPSSSRSVRFRARHRSPSPRAAAPIFSAVFSNPRQLENIPSRWIVRHSVSRNRQLRPLAERAESANPAALTVAVASP